MLTKREQYLLLEDIAKGIYYKKWNLDIGGDPLEIKLYPAWLDKDDEDYRQKTITITVDAISYRFKSEVDEFHRVENLSTSIIELFDKIKAFYDFED